MSARLISRNGKPKGQPEQADEPRHLFTRRFIQLTTCFDFHEGNCPEHVLAIPAGWAQNHNDDFKVEDFDFTDRELALRQAAIANRCVMDQLADGFKVSNDDINIGWTLVFEIDRITKGSWVGIKGGCEAEFNLDTALLLVRPTEEEIEREIEFTERRVNGKAVA